MGAAAGVGPAPLDADDLVVADARSQAAIARRRVRCRVGAWLVACGVAAGHERGHCLGHPSAAAGRIPAGGRLSAHAAAPAAQLLLSPAVSAGGGLSLCGFAEPGILPPLWRGWGKA